MKRIFILGIALCALMMTGFAQTDTTGKQKPDTIKVGAMVIIPGDDKDDNNDKDNNKGWDKKRVNLGWKNSKSSNSSTNWWILDLGFSNWNDETVYTSAAAQAIAPGSNGDWLRLRTGKSRSVNLWIVMQRLNMIDHVVNLKYGVGLELNNYHFDDKSIRFNKNPTLIDQSYNGGDLKKNKLAADYLTVPLMLNFNFTPNKSGSKSFGFSAGVSAGLLYSARQKIKEDGDVHKTKDDFDLRQWKLSYVGELTLGPIRLYGSYAFQSMFEKGLDVTPYNVGFRFSNW